MDNGFIERWESQVKKGLLEFLILMLLAKNELYGYELISELKKRTTYDVAEGTIYPLLNRLKDDNLINSYWQEMESGVPRKYYKITKEGIQNLHTMKAYWNKLSESVQKLMK
jgi:PadR family transcriptional regulator, regulatory protein PadR